MNNILLSNLRKNLDKKKDSQENLVEVNLLDFELLDIIGQGAFGKVRIVEQNSSKKKFALKYINKLECARSKSTRNIFRERIILQQMNNAHILNLKYAFQDDEHLFFVLDLALGGDLKYNLSKYKGFDDQTLKVYSCELSSALNYLHHNSIIHRDLKPDNIILDSQGHAYITDFNCSVSLKERTPDSEAGTLEYMGTVLHFRTPEMFMNKPYRFSVDWWSLGVILYQCCYGMSLFKEHNSQKTVEGILTKQITFAPEGVLAKANPHRDAFLSSLLTRDLAKRSGCSDEGLGFQKDITTQPWLEGVDWGKVDAKQMQPSLIPSNEKNYEKEQLELKESGDLLSLKFQRDKRQSGWLISKVSSCWSRMSRSGRSARGSRGGSNVDLHNNADPSTPTSPAEVTDKREKLELEAMIRYFSVYDYTKPDQESVTMPPLWASKPPLSRAAPTRRKTTSNILGTSADENSSAQKQLERPATLKRNPSKETGIIGGRPSLVEHRVSLTKQKDRSFHSPLREALAPISSVTSNNEGSVGDGPKKRRSIAAGTDSSAIKEEESNFKDSKNCLAEENDEESDDDAATFQRLVL